LAIGNKKAELLPRHEERPDLTVTGQFGYYQQPGAFEDFDHNRSKP